MPQVSELAAMSSQGRGVVLGDFSEEIAHVDPVNFTIQRSSLGRLIGVLWERFKINSAKLTTLDFKDEISTYFYAKKRAASSFARKMSHDTSRKAPIHP
jgi:hypothetical protein